VTLSLDISEAGVGDEMVVELTLAELIDAPAVAQRMRSAGMTDPAASAAKGAAFARCAAKLIERGVPASTVAVALFVPGRIEVMGKHTDYCGGRSLLCAVDRGFCFVATPRADASMNMIAADGDAFTCKIADDLAPTVGHWSNYPMVVARRMARNFPIAWTGCNVAFESDLPPAAGLSSSSAFMVGTFLVLATLNAISRHAAFRQSIHSQEDLGNYLGCVENGSTFGVLQGDSGVGTFGGSQDHTAILCAEPGALVQYAFSPVKREATIAVESSVLFLVVNSGLRAEKTGAALEKYNAVSARARRLVQLWNQTQSDHAKCLREVLERANGDAILRTQISKQTDATERQSLTERLDQYRTESEQLIPAVATAFGAGDWKALGSAVDQSQHLAETKLHNQVAQTILIQKSLRDAGAIAASAFGAGFGGSVWALVHTRDAERVISAVQAQTNLSADRFFQTRPSIAAFLLSSPNATAQSLAAS
jgi:galactokinase